MLLQQAYFWFVRHGETEANAAGLVAGSLETPLTAKGRAQAEQVAEALAREPIAAIWSSPRSRARDTAQPVADRLGLAVRCLDELAERHWGEWEGGALAGLLDRSDTPPGGEPQTDFAQRVLRALDRITAPFPALIVAHGGVGRVICDHLLGAGQVGLLANAVPVRFVRTGIGWHMQLPS